MDPNLALEHLRLNLAQWERLSSEPDYTEVINQVADEIATAAAALDGWLSRGGFLPDDWKNPKENPNIALLHDRDPDGYCEITVFVDGRGVSGYDEYSFDPGAGQEFLDYADTLAEWVANAHPKLKDRLRRNAHDAINNRYVEGRPDDERVASRYFDLLVLRHEREATNATPPSPPAQEVINAAEIKPL